MWLIDFILNIAAVLLWLKWLERDVSTVVAEPRISVVANLRRATPRQPRIYYLGALLLLLTTRSVVYWLLGSALNWVPTLHIGLIPLSFRSEWIGRIFLYSYLSFGEALVILYLSLLLFSIINCRLESDPMQKSVRSYLGWLDLFPTVVKIFLPWVIGLAIWCAFNPFFRRMGIVVPPQSTSELIKQGAFVGFGMYLIWKYVLVAVLILYVLNSYVYFGKWPIWSFIDKSGQQILKPLSWIPLRMRKIDFAPLVAIALVILVGEFGSRKLIEHWSGKKTQTIEKLRR